uniref:Midnolin n=1 Tax=Monodelphis domestica TaxID=13616 RepID=F7DMM0_MONDO
MEPQPSARSCRRGAAPAAPCELLAAEPPMNLCINTTTGARYELSVPGEETVEGLRRRLSQRLKVPKERLALLYKETRLSSGKLQDLGVGDGSKVTLVPTVEAGLMSQASRPEQSVMQALESLTETQVSDFLSGRSPLTLALRVGDHMMFVQLQLAAQQAAGAQLQHRQHLVAGRGDPGAAGGSPSPCRSSGLAAAARVPVTPAYFSPAHPSPVTAGVFRSHGASTQTVDCASHSSSTSPSSSSVSSSLGSSSPPSGSPAPSTRSRKPGAVIESFVNHAPGVFSGTFSGTFATRHYQGMPQSLAQLRCQTQCSPSPELTTKATSCEKLTAPLHSVVQSQIRMCKPTGDRLRQTENRATRCKVERLQLLLQQKRLRRKARRDARGPYHWLSGRKAGRAASSSSSGSGGGSDAGGLDLDFEDSLWKPEVKADLKSEFVVA